MAFDYNELQSKIAQTITNPIDTNLGIDPSKVTDPNMLYYNIVKYSLLALAVAAVIIIIWAGISYITAGGEAEKATRAKMIIQGAVIGLIVIIASYAAYTYLIGSIG